MTKPDPPKKEAWQMTKAEYFDYVEGREYEDFIGRLMTISHEKGTVQGETNIRASTSIHRAYVKTALTEGKPVPPEVLKDYPDLVEKE